MATISLCMIVKNEEPVLERILKPMRTVVDEIIIADTGSTDRTKEIACRYGDQVFDYAWKQDFAAARNAACERASMDYWMWLDADDVIRPDQLEGLRQLKETLDPKIDVVMMRYVAAFDASGRPSFTYYRERLLRNDKTFLWQGRVHEAVTPKGCILYSPITIEHRKEKAGDSRRNLEIYRQMIRDGEALEPRHQFYYGRELFDHGEYEMAAKALEQFLKEPGGWKENRIDACLLLSRCKSREGASEGALGCLFRSFLYDFPRGEICCEIGKLKMEAGEYSQAAWWYKQALLSLPDESSGAFIQPDFYSFIPAVQLCVCYDRLGQREQALYYHQMAKGMKPEDPAVRWNEGYFSSSAYIPKT